MEWRAYRVDVDDNGAVVIEAPSFGVAVEYYLAMHGMMSYRMAVVSRPLAAIATESKQRVLEIINDAESKADELDKHHNVLLLT